MLRNIYLVLSIAGAILCTPHSFKENPKYTSNGIENLAQISEDALADVPEIVAKTKYPIESHRVKTEDGYFLQIHRIPYGKFGPSLQSSKKKILLMHGFISSSSDWVITGPGNGFAYILADNGFDVWMGNARGNYYSRNHTNLDPDTNHHFWRFSWHEIGYYDLPAIIDLALNKSGAEKMHFVGHSQGATAFFVMAATRKEYRDKIISMNALAPAVYNTYMNNPLADNYYPFFDIIAFAIGPREIFPRSRTTALISHKFCNRWNPFQRGCIRILSEICGPSDSYNKKLLPVLLSHTPAGSSTRQLIHFTQVHRTKTFQQFDYGPVVNKMIYKSTKPPKYDLGLIDTPVTIWYGPSDKTTDIRDLERLFAELGRGIALNKVNADLFNHLDFIWGTKTSSVLYEPIIARMNEYR